MKDITNMTNAEMNVLYDEMMVAGLIDREKPDILRLSRSFITRSGVIEPSDMTTDVVLRTLVKEYNITDMQALFDYACVLMMMHGILQKQRR
jgi:hypothetical protein